MLKNVTNSRKLPGGSQAGSAGQGFDLGRNHISFNASLSTRSVALDKGQTPECPDVLS